MHESSLYEIHWRCERKLYNIHHAAMDSGKQAQLVHGNKDDQLVLFISGPAEQLFFHASQFVYAVDD